MSALDDPLTVPASSSTPRFGTCRAMPLHLPDAILSELETAYAEPQRAYHTATHIADVLGWYDEVAYALGWEHEAEVYVAILFHDAVYVPGARDNEAQSAAWARRARIPVDAARVTTLIELTARHATLTACDVDRDAALFLDCDMAILGARPDIFDAYDAAIAREYSAIPADSYEAGRRTFLERLATAPRIFLSDWFHARLDVAARANIARALLRGRDPERG
jgi:predicted metal-dependent HD superfamily phosphohydrolase